MVREKFVVGTGSIARGNAWQNDFRKRLVAESSVTNNSNTASGSLRDLRGPRVAALTYEHYSIWLRHGVFRARSAAKR